MEPGFLGFIDLEDTLVGTLLVTNTSFTPIDADALPTFRVYGPNGFVQSGGGTLKQTAAITAASNASPIVVTSALHGLTVGSNVTITGVVGNTAANATFTISAVTANTFSLSGSSGNGAWTSGGEWHMTGLYDVSIAVLGVSGYEKSEVYQIVYAYALSSTAQGQIHSFQVS